MWKAVTRLSCIFLIPFLIACETDILSDTDSNLPEVREPIKGDGVNLSGVESAKIYQYDADSRSMFLPADIPEIVSENLTHESVIGFTYLQFNHSNWNVEDLKMNDPLIIHLPDDLYIEARVLRSQETLPSLLSVTAQIKEPHEGNITLTHSGNRTIGDIKLESENRHFQIRYDSGSELHYLMEIDPSQSGSLPGAQPLRIQLNHP